MLLIVSSPGSAEIEDFTGDWRFILENANSRKQITMRIEEQDGRLRGKWASKGMGTHDVDGRRSGDDGVLFWSKYETREGGTFEANFRGTIEGDKIVGTANVFRTRYEFTAERATDSSSTPRKPRQLLSSAER